ncbi:MAG TPA: patatin-like phospholipase family protein [Candidatus Kapabacteria bacterium]|nr:patatin-like phospholipase family protein [Candidatus Kapabacteria bacterium]
MNVPAPKIAVSLSGGGSRAIAFHLGCLRALYDRGILDRVQVISAVSGGSVIAAMYAYSSETFDEFDARVVSLLRSGLQLKIIIRLLRPDFLARTLATMFVAGSAAMLFRILALTFKGMQRLFRIQSRRMARLVALQPPLRRWANRTSAFEDVLRARLFGETTVDEVRRAGLDVILNACELRTGTAFRFCNRTSWCWRYGQVVNNDVTVARAVAASAAFPPFLPALDCSFQFQRNSEEHTHRVLLTDGGVFDNLGITPIEPGRSIDYSGVVYDPDYIICCDAGHGQQNGLHVPFSWFTRMNQVVNVMFRKQQDRSKKRLFDLVEHGQLKGLVYAFLGQSDKELPHIPPDFVSRDRVLRFGTDFCVLSAADIECLANRGEQLARLLIGHYCPNI